MPPSVLEEGRQEYEKWRARLETTIAAASAASVSVQTATEWAASAAFTADTGGLVVEQPGLFDVPPVAQTPGNRPASTIQIVDARGGDRPGGARFGELVHAVLASIPLDADRAAILAMTGVHARMLLAPADEAATAAELVGRVLAHDLLARARAAAARGACRRETPLTLSLADGTLLEGVADLAFEENGTWTIIDYKTDRELAAAGEERYRRQVALYASAVAQATGKPTAGVLVRV